MTFRVIDLFAGPGGLGEGFSSARDSHEFQILVSAEMESSAHSTLTLRSFFRHAKAAGDRKALEAYYDYCRLGSTRPPQESCTALWKLAQDEARQLTLGTPKSNETLDQILRASKLQADSSVLIGGPPCQAYSLVGRARNRGIADYVAEEDARHYLYREYLRIVASLKPAVFVMENVKGILSSSVAGRHVFSDILTDLCDPGKATRGKSGPTYTIYSVARPSKFSRGMSLDSVRAMDFVVRCEEYGVPQARHRVILLGIRDDIQVTGHPLLQPVVSPLLVRDAISELPALRSRLKSADDSREWARRIRSFATELAATAARRRPELLDALIAAGEQVSEGLTCGAQRLPRSVAKTAGDYATWVGDPKMPVWLNHEARSHMDSDLRRYLFASVFANHHGRAPKGHHEFDLPGLAPSHKNWTTGKFADRFRVQLLDEPSTTVTSHIAKDGHYFIHPSPEQCRSLTVREAARLQTFPDNYFFLGTRTQQYHQVGNAVPPLLARKIAELVSRVLRGAG